MRSMAQFETTVPIRVTPSASRDEIVGVRNGVLRLRVTTPPQGGRANRAALALLAQALGVPKGRLRITRGHVSRDKVVAIVGLGREEVAQSLGLELDP